MRPRRPLQEPIPQRQTTVLLQQVKLAMDSTKLNSNTKRMPRVCLGSASSTGRAHRSLDPLFPLLLRQSSKHSKFQWDHLHNVLNTIWFRQWASCLRIVEDQDTSSLNAPISLASADWHFFKDICPSFTALLRPRRSCNQLNPSFSSGYMCSPWHLSSYEKPNCGQKIKSGIWFLWWWNLAYFTGGINSSTLSGLTRLTNRKGPVLPALTISTGHIKKKTFPSCPSKKVRLSQFILSLWVCTTGYFFCVWEMYFLSF